MFYILFKVVLFIFRMLDFVIITTVVFLMSLFPKKLTRPFMPKLFRLFCWSFIRFLGRTPCIHESFTPPLPKRYILISNHPSGYEILLLNALFAVTPLAQAGVRKWLFFGRIAEATGTIFVNRDNKNSRSSAKETCIKAVKDGHNVLIYPEGGCYGRDITPFKQGAFNISLETNIPILPVYIQYEAENTYEWGWEDNLIQHLFKMLRSVNKHAHCYIFNPIYPNHFPDAETFKDHVFQLYKNWQQRFKLLDTEEEIPCVEESLETV